MTPKILWFVCLSFTIAIAARAAEAVEPTVLVGVAKVDITPELPIRLSGYGSRTTEATRAETPLYARALAIGGDQQNPVVLITVELIGVGKATTDIVAAALRDRRGIERARLAICATHLHSGPALADVLPFMFSQDLPAAETEHIERYTATLRTKLVQLAGAALDDRKPGRLAWAEGKAGFAAQRRVVVGGKWTSFGIVPEGPADHALPVLRVTDARGEIRAVFLNYACHCTTLGGGENFVHHEWAGDAARRLEQAHAGAVALVGIGCGADANPNPRGTPAVTVHGDEIAREVARLLAGPMRVLGPVTATNYREFPLNLDHAVSREELEGRSKAGAKQPAVYLGTALRRELDAGRALPTKVPYAVQTWTFGEQLAMVFLAGEVVSEYALRLKRELDGPRLWVNAYANSVPCYIPSKRMYAEGGYEVDGAMEYYGWATRLAADTEDRIIAAVHELVPPAFRRAQQP